MKVRKFIKRDRATAGRATGTLLCRLSLPAIDEEYDWRTTPASSIKAIGLIRKFVNRRLPQNPELLTDARFVIEAEIRVSKTRIGRKRLAVWNFGDDLSAALEQASKEWELLELEEDYSAFEVEI
ncbi:MAG: hypothetical protein M3384_12920 [Acidobacteriota bacterium]|nr:hypothetical protein [Acidobacteriota bacterium]